MRISELIRVLHKAKNQLGDRDVYVAVDGNFTYTAFAPVVRVSHDDKKDWMYESPVYLLNQENLEKNDFWSKGNQITKGEE